ncbi:MAG: hypothetical protein HW400_160 [Candidatus Levybacteria bacterium]|nr:hypothetical protein [Candidatus Levybacteria bacterium]
MKKILVLGPSGAGKTHLSTVLKEYGLNAVDVDSIKGLHGWYDVKGNEVVFPRDAEKEFFDNHSFLWNREALVNYLKKNPDVYLFGMSGNAFDMLDLFDKVYYLDVPENLIRERLQHSSRINPTGKTPYQREVAVEWAKLIKERANDLGLTFIDAALTPEELYKLIKN